MNKHEIKDLGDPAYHPDAGPERKRGGDLVVGDVVCLWFNHRARLESVEPYRGTLEHLWPEGAQIGYFTKKNDSSSWVGMTMGNDEIFEVIE